MTIQEYWAKLVAAGLAPDWGNVHGIMYKGSAIFYSDIELLFQSDLEEVSQLRKDGIDLVYLEWQKPTEQDIGKMCWLRKGTKSNIECGILKESKKWNNFYGDYAYKDNNGEDYRFFLSATHGRLAPNVEDFERAYNGNA